MILEIARIDIKPGSESDFEAAVEEAAPLFRAAAGFGGLELQRGIERPSHYVLMIRWGSLEDHMVGFRDSDDFARWRELVGPHFAGPPQMEHVSAAVRVAADV
ncbi:MAG TPA: antibiotic biosynthesis monooxygenase family protein [Caulobacteraceae bacterium]|jgi:heme-degrading monooxygenase HmoA|nr:antibiotic biosynthesis monooxygenase family protein [Caulobacteraceae bacterium]